MEQGHNKYPIILAHGIVLKDFKFFKAFGRIEKKLTSEGYVVYTADTDGFGAIETNAQQLKDFICGVLQKHNADKVNVIAHSKGGLDARYMIENLDMSEHVASLTTICTPHKGSPIASAILRLPKWLTRFVAFWINLWYKIFGDKHPDALKTCKQLQARNDDNPTDIADTHDTIYCQSYSSTLKRKRDDFVMGIPLAVYRVLDKADCDGLVSASSAQFGQYKGDCIDESVSHSEIVDFMPSKRKRERIHAFYIELCDDLVKHGF